MIRLTTDTPQFFSDICEVIRLFWPDAKISLNEGEQILSHTHRIEDGAFVERWAFEAEQPTVYSVPAVLGGLEEKRALKRAVKTGCFMLLREKTSAHPPWGSLTGIRPTRLFYEALNAGLDEREARKWLADTFFVKPDKVDLLSEIIGMQRGLIELPPDAYDLYIGIPFCVTRCAYCSFSSGELGDGHLVEPYLNALEREMAASARLMNELGLHVRAAYMGGGTPTSLSAGQLDRLLSRAKSLFPLAREWTVEAGRPDTIDRDKLRALKSLAIDRISVNPQTFSNDTLARIGRAHTAEQTKAAYFLAREMGFDHVNMDLIACLPGEGRDDFDSTLTETLALVPESVTVHTLAIKRGSGLHEKGYAQTGQEDARWMVDRARARAEAAGYKPYYLYRQKYMAGNLENVGYAKPDHACLYNIDIMEETAPILALGAGAITKWLFPRELRIERAANVRNIEQYISRVDEMIERKVKLIAKK